MVLFQSPVSGVDWFKLFRLQSFSIPPTQESGTITSVIRYVPSNIVHTEYPSVARPVPGISDAINGHYRKDREQLVAGPARNSNVHCYCLDDWRVGHGNLQYCLLHPAAA